MTLFLIGIALLILGYFTYGKLVMRIIGPDDRITPCIANPDGVDYVALPHWKNMLIQLLNIAGIGPVIGVILGIKFGAIVFILLPIGNIIAGATHDALGGIMSMRSNGANLPIIIRNNLGTTYYRIFMFFMTFLLLLLVAVFAKIPATLIDNMIPGEAFFWIVSAIVAYYIIATIFPIDKVIGRFYPFFGALLIISTIAIFIALLLAAFKNPELLSESPAFKEKMFTTENNRPVLPMLFVTIACGIISGFHATQSPLVARTTASEFQVRSTFYGMMVAEGIIGMIWAGAGLAIYNLFPEYMALEPAKVLSHIATHFLGSSIGNVTVLGVVILAITSGDTALRSLRISLAEMVRLPQKPVLNRLAVSTVLLFSVIILVWWASRGEESFNFLWIYFSWGNQVLAASTLLAASVWLARQGKNNLIAIIPGAFMFFIVCTYILWTSPAIGGPVGFGLSLNLARVIGIALTVLTTVCVWRHGTKLRQKELLTPDA